MTNWGDAIAAEFQHVVTFIIAFIPNLLGFLILLGVGWIIAWALEQGITRLLRRLGFDRLANRIGLTRFEQNMGVHMDAASLLGKIVFWFVLLIFLVPACNALGVPVVSNTINTLVNYIPNVFVAILILFLGTLAATVVADLIRGAIASTGIGNPNLFATLARWVIIALAVLMALDQLQIAPALINVLFTTLVGGLGLGLALAFGISFGLGGQESARRWLARGENALGTVSRQIDPEQMRRGAERANREAQLEADRRAQLQTQANQERADVNGRNQPAAYNNNASTVNSPNNASTVNSPNYQQNYSTSPVQQQPVNQPVQRPVVNQPAQQPMVNQPVQQPPLQTGYPQPYNDPRQGRVTNDPNRLPGADEYPTQNQNVRPQPYQETPTETFPNEPPPPDRNI